MSQCEQCGSWYYRRSDAIHQCRSCKKPYVPNIPSVYTDVSNGIAHSHSQCYDCMVKLDRDANRGAVMIAIILGIGISFCGYLFLEYGLCIPGLLRACT